MQDLRVTMIQSDIYWEETGKNLDHFGRLFDRIKTKTHLILLPETFNTGFSINPEGCSEDIHGPTMQFLRHKSEKLEAVIMATLLVNENGSYYNRLVCMHPDGHFETYNKRHLFRQSDEFRVLRRGNARLIIEAGGWKIAPFICYDLRFPVWSKNTYTDGNYGYDLAVYLANWPASRSHIWQSLLIARAIENQAFAIGVNRIGTDGHGTRHTGDSMAVGPKGDVIYIAGENVEDVHTTLLSAGDLKRYRESFPVGLDWDHFSINLKK